MPEWCKNPSVLVNGKAIDVKLGKDGYLPIKRTWSPSDKVELALKIEPKIIVAII